MFAVVELVWVSGQNMDGSWSPNSGEEASETVSKETQVDTGYLRPDGKNLGDIKWIAELGILLENKTWENRKGSSSEEKNIGQVQKDTTQASWLSPTSCLPTISVQG